MSDGGSCRAAQALLWEANDDAGPGMRSLAQHMAESNGAPPHVLVRADKRLCALLLREAMVRCSLSPVACLLLGRCFACKLAWELVQRLVRMTIRTSRHRSRVLRALTLCGRMCLSAPMQVGRRV